MGRHVRETPAYEIGQAVEVYTDRSGWIPCTVMGHKWNDENRLSHYIVTEEKTDRRYVATPGKDWIRNRGARRSHIVNASLDGIIDVCGVLTPTDIRWCMAGMAHVARQNDDGFALAFLATILAEPDRQDSQSMIRLINEAIAMGKERTLTKVMQCFDPEYTLHEKPDVPWWDDEDNKPEG